MQARIEQVLNQSMGLDPASLGEAAIRRSVRRRLAALSLANEAQYLARLQTEPEELLELIESLVVPETWFFRDRQPFTELARLVMNEWLPKHGQAAVRVLSAPCSTGEEPYSIVMALLRAGLPATRVAVDAVDISARALAQATAGVYGRNSFRGGDLEFREQFFQRAREGWRLDPSLRQCVRFRRASLLDFCAAAGRGVYDYVFCRNVLIYFDAATQAKVVAGLRALLATDGVLFTGHAETPLFRGRGFVAVDLGRAFALRKAPAAPSQPGAAKPPRHCSRPAAPALANAPKPAVAPARTSTPPLKKDGRPGVAPPKPAAPTGPESPLAQARQLADHGRLADAVALCEKALRADGPSAPTCCLLGLLRDISGEEQAAADLYRQALYLAPDHYEAAAHLACLLERRGDHAGAQRLRQRARRAEARLGAK